MNPTFEEIIKASPELCKVKEWAEGWCDSDDMWVYYEFLKGWMNRFVGWFAQDGLPEFMYTGQAYDIAHYHIFIEGQFAK